MYFFLHGFTAQADAVLIIRTGGHSAIGTFPVAEWNIQLQ
jgi:hypothetical protein